MTKRIVSGIFVLTALGALGVILAGALTSGEQLIVRFLTAVIVAALGLYVISDLRLQADDDAHTGRTSGSNRVGMVDAPPNSTAAFMATVTKKQDTGEHAAVKPATTGRAAGAGTSVPTKAPTSPPPAAAPAAKIDPTQTVAIPAEPLESDDAMSPMKKRSPSKKRSVASKRIEQAVMGKKPTSGVETVVAGPGFSASEDQELAGVGAAVTSASATGDVPGPDRDHPPTSPTIKPEATEGFQSSSLDISDLFADRGPASGDPLATTGDRAKPAAMNSGSMTNGADSGRNGNHSNGKNGNGSNGANGNGHSNGSNETNGTNGGSNDQNGSNGNFWSSSHISGRLSESAAGFDPSEVAPSAPFFDPTERVYDITGLTQNQTDGRTARGSESNGGAGGEGHPLNHAEGNGAEDTGGADTGDDTEHNDQRAQSPVEADGSATVFQYSDDLQADAYVWPAQPVNDLPEPHPFEKASAAYEAAKRQIEESGGTNGPAAGVVPAGDTAEDQTGLAPIIDLREMVEPAKGDVEAAINAGEVEVIATLIEQGMLSTAGPISDREVRTMVYVAFTSNELRKLLMAGGTPDGPNYGLDLGPVELFDESTHAPAPKRLYSGNPAGEPTRQLG